MHVKTLILLAALLLAAASPAIAEEINPVIGRTDSLTLRETDLDRLLATQPPQVQQQLQEKPELKRRLVQDILLKNAIAREARKAGYDKSPDFREQLSFLIDDFLAAQYLTKVVTVPDTPSEAQLKKYYEDHAKDFITGESVKARQIFFQVPASAPEAEKAKARARAEAVLDRLRKGEDFAKLATELSDDSESAKAGGEIGTIAAGKTNSPEFEKAVLALKSGETSGIIETPFGLHIVKAEERSDRRPATFEEARNSIEATLKRESSQKKGEEFVARVIKESGLTVVGETPAAPVPAPAATK